MNEKPPVSTHVAARGVPEATEASIMQALERGRSLADRNSFGFDQRAEYYLDVHTESELEIAIALAARQGWPVFLLGGGTNLVLRGDIAGLVLCLRMAAIRFDDVNHTVTASAGVPWHTLVQHTLNHDRPGLENLSLIPGSTGAAPVQNIGAYGVELAERFVSCRALHIPSGHWQRFNRSQCEFSYRQSLFKARPGEFAITEVTLAVGHHLPLVTRYASLQQCLDEQSDKPLTAMQISRRVCRIRQEKLPDPARIGNAGSFFKNPVTTLAHFNTLQAQNPGIIGYAQPDGQMKLAAGWLIESLGYKGYQRGGVGVHQQQALVLVHRGGESGSQLLELAAEIRKAVREAYGVTLEAEPVLVP